jgi:hypothetical protein
MLANCPLFLMFFLNYNEWYRLRLSSDINQRSSNAGKQLKRYPCLNLWLQLVVSWNGTLAPCCVYVDTIGDGKGSLFDLKESNIATAWKSPPIQNLRKALLKNDLDEIAPYCINCNDWLHFSPPELWSDKFITRLLGNQL